MYRREGPRPSRDPGCIDGHRTTGGSAGYRGTIRPGNAVRGRACDDTRVGGVAGDGRRLMLAMRRRESEG